jgi:hypothetical protein
MLFNGLQLLAKIYPEKKHSKNLTILKFCDMARQEKTTARFKQIPRIVF